MKTKNNLFPGAIFNVNGFIHTIREVSTNYASSAYLNTDHIPVVGRHNIETYKPLLITPERLKHFGFIAKAHDQLFESPVPYGTYLQIAYDNESWNLATSTQPGLFWGTIQYVHQLQQIYLALHGVLLEIK